MMDVENKPADRRPVANRHRATRSRVSNGRQLFLDGVDARTAIARRFRDLFFEIISDLGGTENTSEGERQLARRCTALAVEAERMEAELASGGEFNVELYVTLTNALGRALSRIGLERRPRDITPARSDYVEAQSGAAQ